MVRAALGLLATLVAVGCGGQLPVVIRDEMTRTSQLRPAATVVFFTDFQCPYCRETHARLAPLLARRGERVRLVLRHVPLPRHPDARGAARAAVCFEKLSNPRNERAYLEYADAMFVTPDLSPQALAAMAEERGLERPRFEECVSEAATDARIQDDLAMFDAVRGDGVPLLYVGRTRLEGAQTTDALAAALDDAMP